MRIKLHDLILTYERPDPDNAVCARGDHLAAICAERSRIDLFWMLKDNRLGWRLKRPHTRCSILVPEPLVFWVLVKKAFSC
jgi:hypothetical protein